MGPTSSLHNTLVTRRRAYPDVNPLNRSPLHASYISRDSCATIRVGGFCAGHVPEFWQLRAIDGYYGLGVPHRLRFLPWPIGASLRTVGFTKLDTVPWDLLGFLNVRWALMSRDGVYRLSRYATATSYVRAP